MEAQSALLRQPQTPEPGGPTHFVPLVLPLQWLSWPHSQLPPPHVGSTTQAPRTQLVAHWRPETPLAPMLVPGAHVKFTRHPPLQRVEVPSHDVEHV